VGTLARNFSVPDSKISTFSGTRSTSGTQSTFAGPRSTSGSKPTPAASSSKVITTVLKGRGFHLW
jgi:hypothetical protein